MATLNRRRWLTAAALTPVAGALAARAADVTSTSAGPSPRETIQARYLPNVVLRTQDDKPVRFYDDLIKDKIVTLNFFYTQCEDGRCPMATANLVRVQNLLKDRVGRDIFMYSFTLTPEHDTPAVLKRYAKAYGVGPGWTFLTGKPGDMEQLRRKLGFAWANPIRDARKASHTGTLRYGNEPLQLWSACPALSKPEWIVESMSWLDGPKEHRVS
jgi:protein SCO1